jgi:hypothetical protein
VYKTSEDIAMLSDIGKRLLQTLVPGQHRNVLKAGISFSARALALGLVQISN